MIEDIKRHSVSEMHSWMAELLAHNRIDVGNVDKLLEQIHNHDGYQAYPLAPANFAVLESLLSDFDERSSDIYDTGMRASLRGLLSEMIGEVKDSHEHYLDSAIELDRVKAEAAGEHLDPRERIEKLMPADRARRAAHNALVSHLRCFYRFCFGPMARQGAKSLRECGILLHTGKFFPSGAQLEAAWQEVTDVVSSRPICTQIGQWSLKMCAGARLTIFESLLQSQLHSIRNSASSGS